ncbi:MAG: hypothetical protein SWQ30_03285 [Thermodesulfobacteriota bacterium]|nr:hypothetical protein [Thermodesulfobacteriota bacterium]
MKRTDIRPRKRGETESGRSGEKRSASAETIQGKPQRFEIHPQQPDHEDFMGAGKLPVYM